MSGCRRQCDWDENQVCRTCGIDYSIVDNSASSTVVISSEEE